MTNPAYDFSVPLTENAEGPRFYFMPWFRPGRRTVLMTADGIRKLKKDYGFFDGFENAENAKTAAKNLSFADALYKLTRGPLRPTLAFPVDGEGSYTPGREEIENLLGDTSLRVMYALGARLFPVEFPDTLPGAKGLAENVHYFPVPEDDAAKAQCRYALLIGRTKFSPLQQWRFLHGERDPASADEAAAQLAHYNALLLCHAETGRQRTNLFHDLLGKAPRRPEIYLNPMATSAFADAMREAIDDYLGGRLPAQERTDARKLARILGKKTAPWLPDWDLGKLTQRAHGLHPAGAAPAAARAATP